MEKNANLTRFILFLSLIFTTSFANAQQNIYVVKLKDKNNSPYSVNRPAEFLTQKSIDRRLRQHIGYSEEDLPVNPSYKTGIESTGVRIRLELKWFNSLVIQTTADKIPSITALSYVASIKSLGPIPSALQSKVKPFFKNETTENPYFKRAATTTDYGQAKAQIEQVNGQLLHNMNLLGQGMTIAVLDAGFRNLYTLNIFDSLLLKGRVKGVKDFTYMPDFLTASDEPHGTEVLSLLAGWDNGSQIGTAPDANYYLLRTEDATSESPVEEYNWAAGAAYADSVGVDIITSSLGYFVFDAAYSAYSYSYSDLNGHTAFVTQAAAKAAKRGILVVNAAGNEGADSWKHIIAPADADSILTVGAVNTQGMAASFTSQGPSADGRIKPDVAACGWGTVIANPITNGLITGSGTSFSTPLTAGLCACLWQGNPEATNQDLIKALQLTASQSLAPDNILGYGVASFYKAYELLKKEITSVSVKKPNYVISANPFPDRMELIITSNSSTGWNIDVYSILGKLVERHSNVASNQPVSIGSKCRSGVYILRINSGSLLAIEKIIKS